ncbi:MAG: hypothetical protein A3E18_02415 [Candidatus Nealsonbacteria bacterium RIFCSPHIGHO2_12_FULL_38_18]|nr:MAG: hypothetical protein A3E18_02415 [Candidatus Nealsonbacteria bacterium RIFCSPHIGHO2_12_FULL_38_18]
MFVYVGGISGVGKTTIIRKTIELSQKSNSFFIGLSEKELLCKITKVKSAEYYAELPEEVRAEARKQLVDYLYRIDEKNLATIRIRDDHFTAPKEDGTYWIRQLEKKDKAHMFAFVVIIAKPGIILQRRFSRGFIPLGHRFSDVDEIILHQEMETRIASFQADHLQIPFKIIDNREGRTKQTSALLFSFIQKITETKRR